MSVLHHESILEDCMEQAITEFCEANKLTPDMFALIEDHLGVQIALDRKANALFEERCVLCLIIAITESHSTVTIQQRSLNYTRYS